MSGWNEPKLDELFAAYRDALPDRDPSAGFMPELWRRIDQRRKPSLSFGRFARVFVTASLALCFAAHGGNLVTFAKCRLYIDLRRCSR